MSMEEREDGRDTTGSSDPGGLSIPPLNTYVVRRYKPGPPGGENIGEMGKIQKFYPAGEIEEITIKAHLSGTNASNILRFVQVGVDPVVGVREWVVVCFNDWIDYREVFEQPTASKIVVASGFEGLQGGSGSIN